MKKEFDDILTELNNAKKDINSTIDVTKQIKNTVTNDVNMICEKISIPTLNTKNISQMIFGTKWVSRVEKVLYYIDKFKPEKVVLNHMASECDYDYVNAHTPQNVEPAFDNLILEW